LHFRGTDHFAAWVHQDISEDAKRRIGTGAQTPKGVYVMKHANPHHGSSFERFLKEEGIHEEATAQALKRVLAWQIEKAMKAQRITKVEMARRMGTSRAHLDRLLDPRNAKVQLDTVQRAASAVGRRLRVELV
jgi:antitoxin HicB